MVHFQNAATSILDAFFLLSLLGYFFSLPSLPLGEPCCFASGHSSSLWRDPSAKNKSLPTGPEFGPSPLEWIWKLVFTSQAISETLFLASTSEIGRGNQRKLFWATESQSNLSLRTDDQTGRNRRLTYWKYRMCSTIWQLLHLLAFVTSLYNVINIILQMRRSIQQGVNTDCRHNAWDRKN